MTEKAAEVQLAQRIQKLQLPIFREITALAAKYNAIDLGGGTPDFEAPAEIKAAGIAAIDGDFNQYAPSQGVQELRAGIAARFKRQHRTEINFDTEITVCCGATEGIAAALFTVINPGDEVIILEPSFTIYAPDVIMCGGTPIYVPLSLPDFHIDRERLQAGISSKTKAIIINSPHNPTGRVFSEEELELVAGICRKHGLIAIIDEIYDEILFDEIVLPRLWLLPGMRQRTIAVNGFSKTYSITGWRLGFVIAPPELTTGIRIAHNYLTISAAAPLQQAAIRAVKMPDEYYQELKRNYRTRRDLLYSGLKELGIPSILPQGGYFLLADVSHLGWQDDVSFVREMIKTVGVSATPLSGFYHKTPLSGPILLRFAFCKREETLTAALVRLEKYS